MGVEKRRRNLGGLRILRNNKDGYQYKVRELTKQESTKDLGVGTPSKGGPEREDLGPCQPKFHL